MPDGALAVFVVDITPRGDAAPCAIARDVVSTPQRGAHIAISNPII